MVIPSHHHVVMRCWVIWTKSGLHLGVLQLMLLLSFLPCCRWRLLVSFFSCHPRSSTKTLFVVVMGTLWTLQSSQPGLSLYSKSPQAYGTSYYAISLGVNVILTILITIRLFMYRRMILDVLPEEHARYYVSLATIMVESAALYSVLALVSIITYAINNPLNQVFLSAASPAQVCAPIVLLHVDSDACYSKLRVI